MKNADYPAAPIPGEDGDWQHRLKDLEFHHTTGLTKREQAAIQIMAGFAANANIGSDAEAIASKAVYWADELMKELDK